MKLKHCFFLPFLLCFTFLFRMCFLSFGPIKHTVIPINICATAKSKLLKAGLKKRQQIAEHSNAAFNSVSKLKKSNRGVIGRKLKLPILISASFENFLITIHSPVSKINLLVFSENNFVFSQKSATSSILRI
jgi:hypothetical protein